MVNREYVLYTLKYQEVSKWVSDIKYKKQLKIFTFKVSLTSKLNVREIKRTPIEKLTYENEV